MYTVHVNQHMHTILALAARVSVCHCLATKVFIGEWERANLVIQLAQYIYIYIYIWVLSLSLMFYVILNTAVFNIL